MSYILEALRKADAERERGAVPDIHTQPLFASDRDEPAARPRWILPLLCRRGHVSRNEIGAIRITANETLFEVPGALAARFLDAVRRTAGEDDDVEIAPVDGKPRRGDGHLSGMAVAGHL